MEIKICTIENCKSYFQINNYNNDIIQIVNNAKEKYNLPVVVENKETKKKIYFILSYIDEEIFKLFSKFNQSMILFKEHLSNMIEKEYIELCILS